MLAKADYWVLDALATGGVRLDWLVEKPAALKANYFTEPPPLTQHEIDRVLTSLSQRGLIEILAPPDFRQSYSFARLTRAGAEVWESWAEPIWRLYTEEVGEEDFSYDGDETAIQLVRFTAENEQRLDQALFRASLFLNHRIVGISEISQLEPWDLFGWKSLPTAVTRRVLIRFQIDQAVVPLQQHWDHDFRRWRTRGFNSSECFRLEAW